jgi:hypothetical protein
MTVVKLRGEGSVEWEFELPLSEVFADQVKGRGGRASARRPRVRRARGREQPKSEKSIDEMSGPELDELAAKLEIDGWKSSAKVGDKKATLKEFVAAKAAAGDEDVAELETTS